ncbi:hypothetical protein GCM10010170_030430 [Dactylosporangium salmoneum]|uniref:Uncharacterized protein n=1 Tax=Dactylosporangium salmoneum TaxID=53361 RepID=A0ABP5T4A6_9ACTN
MPDSAAPAAVVPLQLPGDRDVAMPGMLMPGMDSGVRWSAGPALCGAVLEEHAPSSSAATVSAASAPQR